MTLDQNLHGRGQKSSECRWYVQTKCNVQLPVFWCKHRRHSSRKIF